MFATKLLPFNGVNPQSVVIMDNASIHHVEEVRELIEVQAGAKLLFLPPYSTDLMPVEGIFSQVKSLMKQNHQLFEACMHRSKSIHSTTLWINHSGRLLWTYLSLWVCLEFHPHILLLIFCKQ